MDLSQDVTYGPITFTSNLGSSAEGRPFSGFVLDSVDFSPIPVSFHQEKIPLGDGVTLSDMYLGGRTISIWASIYGSSKGDLNDHLATFRRMFSPRTTPFNAFYDYSAGGFAGLRLEFQRATINSSPYSAYYNYTPGYIPLICPAVPIAQPWHGPVTAKDSADGPHTTQVGARLLARDPYFYAFGPLSAGISVSAATGALSPGTFPDDMTNLPYLGDAPTMMHRWYVTLTGTGPSTLRLATNTTYIPGSGGNANEDLWLDLSGYGAGDYTISALDRAIYDGNNIVTGAIKPTSVFAPCGTDRFSLIPSNLGAFYAASSYTNISSVTISSYEAFF